MNNNHKIDAFVSVVSVLHNQEDIVEDFLQEVYAVLDHHFVDYEIVLIDHHSTDKTVSRVENKLSEIPSIRLIELSESDNKDVAWAAGLENAIGDFVVLLCPELDPPSVIPLAVQKSWEGKDIIVGTSTCPYKIMYRILGLIFNTILKKWISYNIPHNATELRVLSRRAVNTITRTGRYRYTFFVRISKAEYPQSTIQYEQIARRGYKPQKSLWIDFHRAIGLLVFNTTSPLRLMSCIGMLGSFLSFSYALYTIIVRLWKNNVVEGWTSLSVVFSSLFFLMFIMQGFFGEYLSRLLDDFFIHRDYDVVFEKNSSVMLKEERCNVLQKSTSQDSNAVQTGKNK